MKNFKKSIIFIFLILILIFCYIIYYNQKNKYNDVINENLFLDVKDQSIEEENLAKGTQIIVHIAGEVRNPGLIKIEENSRLFDVIEQAGGLTENADIDKINLAYIVSDGQKIHIPNVNDSMNSYEENINQKEIFIEEENVGNNIIININTATKTELETLAGIGPSTALKIINYRKQNGKFRNIEDIKNVSGIGNAKFEQIKNNICV